MKTKKKYLMLVFEENSDKSLEFYSDNPYRGRLSDIVYGDNVKELMISSDGHSKLGKGKNIITIVIARTSGLRKKIKNINHNGMKSSRCLTKQKKS